jgi:hypothetical protein
MKNVRKILIFILGALAALLMVVSSNAENVKNLPDSANYVMWTSTLIDHNTREICGDVMVSKQKGIAIADFFFESPLVNQEYTVIQWFPQGMGGYTYTLYPLEIGTITTDENGVGSAVIEFDPDAIDLFTYDLFLNSAPPSPPPGEDPPPPPPVPTLEEWLARSASKPMSMPMLLGVVANIPPPTPPEFPPDGSFIFNGVVIRPAVDLTP